jgi:CHAD domain-containing protein
MANTAAALFRKPFEAFIEGAKRIHKGDVEALHGTRVASRRLRELVPLLGLDPDTSGNLGRQLAKVTKRLGKVRELDVLLLVIEELSRDGGYSSTALKQLATDVETERAVARERLAAKLPPRRLKRIAAKLRRAALESDDRKGHGRTVHHPRQPWLLALEARVARRATDLRCAIEAAGTVYVPERLHDVRIALKKLRYAAELVAEVRHPRVRAAIGTLRTAQDRLGCLHDRQVLIERARSLEATASPSPLTPANDLGSLARDLEADCRRLHAGYMRDRTTLILIADQMGQAQPVEASVTRRVAS